MATDQVRIKSLYTELYRTIVRFGLLIAAAWLFAAFSYYLSGKTGTDWFSRSGSVMALAGATVAFRFVNVYQPGLAAALKEGVVSVARGIELGFEPPRPYQVLSHTSVISPASSVPGSGATGTYCSERFRPAFCCASRHKTAADVRFGSRLCENAVNDLILLRFGRRIR
jgi:hypothetical protein